MLINRFVVHRVVFFIALMFLLVGIPFCRPFMSIGGILLVANWFLEGDFVRKWYQTKNNKLLFIVLLFFFVYLMGLVYTENYPQAWKSIWLKIPLFFIPVIFATTKPLSTIEFHNLLKVYLVGVLISSVYGFIHYHQNDLIDKREIAVYISYIRFEMNLCLAVFISLYLLQKEKYRWQQCLLLIYLAWIFYLIIYVGALTALIMLVLSFCVLLLKKAFEKKDRLHRILLPLVFLLGISGAILYTYVLVKNYYTVDFDAHKADVSTVDGNPYVHDTNCMLIENGSYVYTYVCELELKEAWDQRSRLPYNGMDIHNEHTIKNTLMRYLNSKGLRKDRVGVESLSDNDIKNIENGIANVAYVSLMGYKSRLYGLLWELSDYKKNKVVSGYTLPQRIELWKNALLLIKQQPLLGVGSGDINDAFARQLLISDSPLKNTNKLCHNQFLLFFIGFGVVGFFVIMFSILYPFIKRKAYRYDLFLIFMLIMFFSMMTDDTLERQDGLTLFAFFNAYFLFFMPFFPEKKRE